MYKKCKNLDFLSTWFGFLKYKSMGKAWEFDIENLAPGKVRVLSAWMAAVFVIYSQSLSQLTFN